MWAKAKKRKLVDTGAEIRTGGRAIGSMLEKKCSIGCAYLKTNFRFSKTINLKI
jgi:hypothetical protein